MYIRLSNRNNLKEYIYEKQFKTIQNNSKQFKTIQKLLVAILLLAISVTGFYACKKSFDENNLNEPINADVKQKIVAKYKTDIFNEPLSNIDKQELNKIIIKKSVFFRTLSTQLDLVNITKTRSSVDNITIYLIPLKNSTNRILLLQGLDNKGSFVITSEYLLDREVQSENKGKIMITSGTNEKLLVSYNDGSKVYQNQTPSKSTTSANGKVSLAAIDDCSGNHGGINFCQKEPGESFSTCYKAEVDEFCDAVVSCAALLYWQVQALIIASCNCSATLCPQTSVN